MTAVYKHINLSYLDQMCDGDQEMFHTMLGMILQELPEEVGKLLLLCQKKDWKEVHAVSHKLKSTLSFVGNDLMTELNRKVELDSKLGTNLGKLEEMAKSMLNILPNVISDLKLAMSQTD